MLGTPGGVRGRAKPDSARRPHDVRVAVLCRTVPVAGRQIHDANIVATMLTHGERRLVTFNGRDFCRYGDRIELFDLEADA